MSLTWPLGFQNDSNYGGTKLDSTLITNTPHYMHPGSRIRQLIPIMAVNQYHKQRKPSM